MTFIERKEYCEQIIAPYKDQLSDEVLAEIYRICEDYDLEIEPNAVYTDEELKEFEMNRKFEIYDTVSDILYENGFPVYDDLEDESTYIS